MGAFGTPPIPSLCAEAVEPSLKHKRLRLAMNFYLKIKSLPVNPCFDPINNLTPSELFEKSKTDPLFGTRILPHIVEADIDPISIDSQYERPPPPPPPKSPPPPWEQNNITSLSCFKTDQTSETVFQKEYQQLRERYNSYFEAYRDGRSVSRNWQLLHFTLKTLMTPELFVYETTTLFLMPN